MERLLAGKLIPALLHLISRQSYPADFILIVYEKNIGVNRVHSDLIIFLKM